MFFYAVYWVENINFVCDLTFSLYLYPNYIKTERIFMSFKIYSATIPFGQTLAADIVKAVECVPANAI